VKEFKQKANDMQLAQGTAQYDELVDYMRKEEKRLAVMIKT